MNKKFKNTASALAVMQEAGCQHQIISTTKIHKKMKKFLFAVALLPSVLAFSQVGINNASPAATLDVTAKTTDGSKPEGLIAPRLTGDQIKSGDTKYTTAQTGTLVYATAAATTPAGKTINITAPGYYYYDAPNSVWQKVANGTSAAASEPWYNVATNTGATSNTQNIYQMGKVGIGTSAPATKLEVNNGTTAGAIKIVDGTQGLNKVLTSDANGVGTWKTAVASWGAYVYGIEKSANDGTVEALSFPTSASVNDSVGYTIVGTGGSIDATNNKIYLPGTGTFRMILYADFEYGTANGTYCTDLRFEVYDSSGTSLFHNCDDVGPHDANRKNGYMQSIFTVSTTGCYIQVSSGSLCNEGVISVEHIK